MIGRWQHRHGSEPVAGRCCASRQKQCMSGGCPPGQPGEPRPWRACRPCPAGSASCTCRPGAPARCSRCCASCLLSCGSRGSRTRPLHSQQSPVSALRSAPPVSIAPGEDNRMMQNNLFGTMLHDKLPMPVDLAGARICGNSCCAGRHASLDL